MEVAAQGGDALGLEEFDGVEDFEGGVLGGGCGVELVGRVGGGTEMFLDVLLEVEEPSAADGGEGEWFADVEVVEGGESVLEGASEVGEDEAEFFGEWDFFELKVQVMDVRFDVGVGGGADLYGLDVEVGADFDDFVEVVAGAGGHGEAVAVWSLFAVGVGDEDIGVVTNSPVGFVVDDEADVVEVEAFGDEVVFDDLGGADDDLVVFPGLEAFVRVDFAGEHGDRVGCGEVGLKKASVLTDQGFGWGEEKDPVGGIGEVIGYEEEGDDGFTHTGGEDDEGALFGGDVSYCSLVFAGFEEVWFDGGLGDVHSEW